MDDDLVVVEMGDKARRKAVIIKSKQDPRLIRERASDWIDRVLYDLVLARPIRATFRIDWFARD